LQAVKASLSLAEARRLTLKAQGFGGPREKPAQWPAMAKALNRLHLLQIDSVNVLVRSHYLPLYSRLGAYDRQSLDLRTLAGGEKRSMFECWAHEASLVQLELHPLMRWRMARARDGKNIYGNMSKFAADEKTFLKSVLAFVKSHGPTAQSDLADGGKGAGGWWGWSKGKLALETLFAQGHLTTSKRESFERFYDVPERVLPAHILNLPTPSERQALMELTALSAQTLGVGSAFDLRDYFRLPGASAQQALRDCCDEGLLLPIGIAGWKAQAYIHSTAKFPKSITASALVSPFDPIIWHRDRAERLFNFHYRIELYTPQPKRKFGYYVLPFIHGEEFAGRVCLKADRTTKTLLVNASHVEAGRDPHQTAQALATELHKMRDWLGLQDIRIAKSGSLANALRATF
jgi:uncharacterized protein